MHSHIGFDASLVDYLHKRKFPVIGPIASWAVKAASLGALWGIYEFNTNDVGESALPLTQLGHTGRWERLEQRREVWG